MNNTQSIIIYRSPYEQQFYESGLIFNVIVFVVLALVLSFSLNWIADRFINFKVKRSWGGVSYLRGSSAWNKAAFTIGIGVAFYVAFIHMVI